MAPNLVIQTAFLGDLLLSIPLLRFIKANDSTRPLIVLCRKGFGPLLTHLQVCDEAWEVDKKDSNSLCQLKTRLKTLRAHTVFCPHESLRSALLVRSIRADHKIGFHKWWNFWAFDRRIQRPLELPDALRQLCLVQPEKSGATDWLAHTNSLARETTYEFLNTPLPEHSQMHVGKKSIRKQLVLLAPGSTWNTKRWTQDGFREVGQRFVEDGFEVTLIGSPEEHELCAQITKGLPQVQNLSGQISLIELYELMLKARLLITNDSGAMHLATVADLPVVSVFGPTTLTIGYRPWSQKAIVVQKDLSCRPCGLHGAQSCPIATHACMKDLKADSVISSARFLLKST